MMTLAAYAEVSPQVDDRFGNRNDEDGEHISQVDDREEEGEEGEFDSAREDQ